MILRYDCYFYCDAEIEVIHFLNLYLPEIQTDIFTGKLHDV